MTSALDLLLLNSGPRQVTIPLTTALPPGWPFTRTGNTATTLVQGVVTPVLANVPRFPTDANGVPLGYWNEPAATNLFLNSQAPATQTITVTAQAYTLSFYGTGTIALTGTYTGTLTGTGAGNLVQLTFTPTAGALIATLTGAVTNVQLEAGSFATSRIITGATAVTRNADNLAAPLSLYPWLQTARGDTWVLKFTVPASGEPSARVFTISDGSVNNFIYATLGITTNQLSVSSIVGGTPGGGTLYNLNPVGSINTLAISRSAAGVTFSLNRAAPVLVAVPGLPKMLNFAIGRTAYGGSSWAAMNALSLTLRQGPTSAAWLRGGNY